MMKILEFKTISPFFEWERDGERPFTDRRWDSKDKRFRALSQFSCQINWGIRISNPTTGESFVRKLLHWDWVRDLDGFLIQPNWAILYLGERIDENDRKGE